MGRPEEYRAESWIRTKFKEILDLGHESEVSPLVQWSLAARKQAPVLFVGAGFSRNAQPRKTGVVMQDWNALVRSLAAALPKHSTGGDALWTAERFRGAFGPQRLFEKVLDAVPDREFEPGKAHDALTSIQWHSILTFNYDTLLERAFERNGKRRVLSVVTERQLVRATTPDTIPVIHLHGHIEHPDSIVLTLDDFRRYPERRPLFVTIARQLLAQHPTLFLGFSATDPNFVAWSGWLSDCVGASSPAWLRLDFYPQGNSKPPVDAGFEAFWSPRLQTVAYPGDRFSELMEAISAAVSPLGANEHLGHAIELGGWDDDSTSRENLRVIDSLIQVDPRYLEEGASEEHRHAIASAMEKMLHARIENSVEVEECLGPMREKIAKRERNLHASGMVAQESTFAQLPTLEEQRARIRKSLGIPLLVEWLVPAVREMGMRPAVSDRSDVAFFDAAAEFRQARDKGGMRGDAREKLLELGLLVSSVLLEMRMEGESASQALSRSLGISSPEDVPVALRDLYDDAVMRLDLESEEFDANENDDGLATAQSFRRRAYLAARQGDHGAAWLHYRDAVRHSQLAVEPEWLELETIMQARRAYARSDSDVDGDEERLARRAKFLESPPRAATMQGVIEERDTLRYHFGELSRIRRLTNSGRDPSGGVVWRGEPLLRQLQRMESYWLYYSCQATAHRLVGVFEYRARWADITRLWRRYGLSEGAVDVVTGYVLAPRADVLAMEMVRFLGEWCLRTAATKNELCLAAMLSSELPVDAALNVASRLVPFALEEGAKARGTSATEGLLCALRRLRWEHAEKVVMTLLQELAANCRPAFYYENVLWGMLQPDIWAGWVKDDEGAIRGFGRAVGLCRDVVTRKAERPDRLGAINGFAAALLGSLSAKAFDRKWPKWRVVDALDLRALFEGLAEDVTSAELNVLLRRHLGVEVGVLHDALGQCNGDDDGDVAVAWFHTAPEDVSLIDLERVRSIREHCERKLGQIGADTPKIFRGEFAVFAYLVIEALCIEELRGVAPVDVGERVRRALSLAPWALHVVIESRVSCAAIPAIQDALSEFLAPFSCDGDTERRQFAALAALFRVIESEGSMRLEWVVRAAALCESQNPYVASTACRFAADALELNGDVATGEILLRALCRGLDDRRALVAGGAVASALGVLTQVPEHARTSLLEKLEPLRGDIRSPVHLAFRRGDPGQTS